MEFCWWLVLLCPHCKVLTKFTSLTYSLLCDGLFCILKLLCHRRNVTGLYYSIAIAMANVLTLYISETKLLIYSQLGPAMALSWSQFPSCSFVNLNSGNISPRIVNLKNKLRWGCFLDQYNINLFKLALNDIFPTYPHNIDFLLAFSHTLTTTLLDNRLPRVGFGPCIGRVKFFDSPVGQSYSVPLKKFKYNNAKQK